MRAPVDLIARRGMDRDAALIARDPARYADQPGLRTIAWAVLMARRGHAVSQRRLNGLRPALAAQDRPAARRLEVVR